MQISIIDFILIIVYFLVVLWIGYYTMKKITSFDDYSVAGRSMPMALVYATIGATLVGGGATIGRVSFVYETGIVVFLALLGVVISQVLSGFFLAPRIRSMKDIYTIGDIMDFYFGRSGQLISSIIAFLFMASLFGVQVLAMGRILETITGVSFVTLCVVGTLIIIAYTWAGGMLAVIYTDTVQFILLIASIATATLLGIKQMGGMTQIIEKVGAINPDNLVFFGGPWTTGVFISAFLAFLLGDTLAPYYIQRYASSKTSSISKWSTVSFGVTYIFLTIVIMVIGLIGIVVFPNMQGDLVFVNFIKMYMPIGVVGLVFGGLLAVVMSTGSSLLNTAAVIYSRDIYSKLINNKATDEKLLNSTKYATIIVGLVGIVISLLIPNVMNLMLYTYTLWAPSILPPLVIALVWGGPFERKVSPYAGPPAMIAGMLMTIIWLNILGEPFGIPAIVMGIVTNLIVFFITHFITFNKTSSTSASGKISV